MDDLERLKEYDREIEEQRKYLNKLLDEKKKLQSNIAFDRIPEGDACNARHGDSVMVLKEGSYKGRVGTVHEKTTGTAYDDDSSRSKSFAVYEVLFPDNSIFTFHHTVLKKV